MLATDIRPMASRQSRFAAVPYPNNHHAGRQTNMTFVRPLFFIAPNSPSSAGFARNGEAQQADLFSMIYVDAGEWATSRASCVSSISSTDFDGLTSVREQHSFGDPASGYLSRIYNRLTGCSGSIFNTPSLPGPPGNSQEPG
jgi:hypothetical protein